jgi:hypothetical protein
MPLVQVSGDLDGKDTDSGETTEFDPKTGKPVGQETVDQTKTEEEKPQGQNTPENDQKETEEKGHESQLPVSQQKVHIEALSLIGAKLQGDKNEARQFFLGNPEIAAIANKSKKHKENYRSLMESDEEEPETPPQKSEPEKKPKETEKTGNDDDVNDEDKLADKIYAKNLERSIVAERKTEAQQYAARHGINIDDADSLFESAEAVYKANKGELDYSKCLDGAKAALEGTGSQKPASIPGGSSKGETEIEVNESSVEDIMQRHNVDRKTAEGLHKTMSKNKGAKTGEWNTY